MGRPHKGHLRLEFPLPLIRFGVSRAIVPPNLSPNGAISKAEGALPVPRGNASLSSCGDDPPSF
jgi:hypothetical protein